MDILGAGTIETKFSGYCAGENPRVLVDLSQVEFLASIGIRLLVLNAKSVTSRGGRMVLLSPIPEERAVLKVTGIPAIIPIYDGLELAEAVLLVKRKSFFEVLTIVVTIQTHFITAIIL